MATGKCSAYSSPQADSKVKSADLACELAATWRTDFHLKNPSELSQMAFHHRWKHCRYRGCIIIMIIIIIISSSSSIIIISHVTHRQRVGGMAQWLRRRSLAGGLSLICAWTVVDKWSLYE